ncbi:hypothetical protein IQ17_00595 [Bradyrhizobium daqingense]|uniref:Uncharacterized protein n=1 Tax=Bradyrhizobium daqingense TaxID=993502 RepID=A0A562LUY2_9BRAD|nr:hypothetical protein IQ17_00595 [Bradyrhizobium daqingense]
MNSFGVHVAHRIGIRRDVPQRRMRDEAERLVWRELGLQRDRLGMLRAAGARDEQVTLLGLRAQIELCPRFALEVACKPEQICNMSGLQFQLQLGDGPRPSPGADAAPVDRKFDLALPDASCLRRAMDVGLEDGLQLARKLSGRKVPERRMFRLFQVGRCAGNLVLPFAPCQAARAARFHGLNVTALDLADA